MLADYRQDIATLHAMPLRRLFSYLAAIADLKKERER
ncbi:hypothetical protein M2323_002738 [Rhodoblastus acidophilus]|nr:hypothetical protein [Rhodoblastus acidophilus]MCW2333802.1 hypothetical protein [Rhodoblastus acidophilus]